MAPEKVLNFIGGKATEATTGETFESTDPATGEAWAEVAKGGREDARAAVEAAREAFQNEAWRDISPSERGRLLYRLAQLLRERIDDFALWETRDNGKTLREAKGDMDYAAWTLEYYAGLADKIEGAQIPVPGDRVDFTYKEPLGVTVHIAPWNYPLQLLVRSLAPALAAGNTAVCKPATWTPVTALRLAELATEAGFPPGVVNALAGPGSEAGAALVEDADVDLVALTGSVETGKQVMEVAAQNLTRVNLELGGKCPNIVFPDAVQDYAVKGAQYGAFLNAGQMCWAGSRLFLHEDVHDDFVDQLKGRVEQTKLGAGTDEGVHMGPLVHRQRQDEVLGAIEEGKDAGATLVCGGTAPGGDLERGAFVEPTIFTDVPDESALATEEIFGPVLSVFSFEDMDEVVERANAVRYGLYAGVWTNDLTTAHRVAKRLESGMVSVNEYPRTYPMTPFVGWKESGIGSEQGISAIDHYVRTKNVNIRLG